MGEKLLVGSRAACPFLNVLLTFIPEALSLSLDCCSCLDSFLLLFLSLSCLYSFILLSVLPRILKNEPRQGRHSDCCESFVKAAGTTSSLFTEPNPEFFFIIISFHVFSSRSNLSSCLDAVLARSTSRSFIFGSPTLLRSYYIYNIILLASISLVPPVMRR